MHILIADDEPISRRLLENYLTKWGHQVTSAEDGEQAWKLFLAGDFPIVITDWMMPGTDGIEVIRRIRESDRSEFVYTILLTARAQKEDLVEGMDAGADDFVTKPFDRDELRVRVREGERIVRLERQLAQQTIELREIREILGQRGVESGAAREVVEQLPSVQSMLDELTRDLANYQNGLRQSVESIPPVEQALTQWLDKLRRIQERLRRPEDTGNP